jgi:hypothetical protein
MFLQARLFPKGNSSLEIILKSLPSDPLQPLSARYPVKVTDPVLSEIIREGDAADGFGIGGETIFTGEELQLISHFECVCRKYVQEGKRSYEHNYKVCDSSELIHASAVDPIRLTSGFALDKVGLKPNMIGAIGEWTNEYIIGAALYDSLKLSNFNGWLVKPLLNLKKNSPYDEYNQLYSPSILKPAIIDCSVEQIKSSFKEENGRLRHLGCLAYFASDLAGQPDFSRTAEPWAGWHGWPSWVVSARVVNFFQTNKFRGWAFRPVLTVESGLYQEYLEQWQVLCEIVARSSRCRFEGSRW